MTTEPITRGNLLEWVDYKIEDVVYDLTQCSSPIEANTHKRDRAILQALRSLLLEPDRRDAPDKCTECGRPMKRINNVVICKDCLLAYEKPQGARGEGKIVMKDCIIGPPPEHAVFYQPPDHKNLGKPKVQRPSVGGEWLMDLKELFLEWEHSHDEPVDRSLGERPQDEVWTEIEYTFTEAGMEVKP